MFVPPPPPPNQNAPRGRLRGGGSRDTCWQTLTDEALPLTALLPVQQEPVWGLTAASHPQFWFYVPASAQSAELEFVLQDATDAYVYRTRLQASTTAAGLVQVVLPESMPPLTVGQDYTWTLAMICDPQHRSRDRFVQGRIQRVRLSTALTQQLPTLSPIEQVPLLAAAGLWYDTLATLGELHVQNPEDTTILAAWLQLMQEAGLTAVARMPLLTNQNRMD